MNLLTKSGNVTKAALATLRGTSLASVLKKSKLKDLIALNTKVPTVIVPRGQCVAVLAISALKSGTFGGSVPYASKKLANEDLTTLLAIIKEAVAFSPAPVPQYVPPCLQITSCQVFPIKEPVGKTVAYARCVLNDQIQLTGIRVIDGMNGLFVSYPNDPTYKGDDYRPLFYPVTRELRDHIEETLLVEYKSVKDAIAEHESVERAKGV